MMSVSDFFYGGREPVWITPNSGHKSSSSNPHPHQYNQTSQQYNQQAMQYSPLQPVPYNVQTPQSANRGGGNADGQQYNSVVELKVPVCCEACEERVKHALLNVSGKPFCGLEIVHLNLSHAQLAPSLRVSYFLMRCPLKSTTAHSQWAGVESVKCDTFTQRVTVTGNVAPAEVLRICRKLHKRSELLQKKGPQHMMASPKW